MRKILGWLQIHQGWLKWLLALSILSFLFYQHREGVRQLEWSNVHIGLLVAAFLVCGAAMLLTYVRWYFLVWAQELPFTVSDAVRLGMIGYLFNFVAPGAVGGDLVKVSLIIREQQSRRFIAAATVLLDRIVGMIGLFLLAAFAMSFPTGIREAPGFQYIITIILVGSLVSVAGTVFLLMPWTSRLGFVRKMTEWKKVGPILGEIIRAMQLYQSHWRVIVLSILISVVSHAGLIASIYLAAAALHGFASIPSFLPHMQFVPPAELVGVFVPLPAGTGALEGAIAYFYDMAGSSRDSGFLAAVAYRLITVVLALIGAGWYLRSRRAVDQAIKEAEELDAAPVAARTETPMASESKPGF